MFTCSTRLRKYGNCSFSVSVKQILDSLVEVGRFSEAKIFSLVSPSVGRETAVGKSQLAGFMNIRKPLLKLMSLLHSTSLRKCHAYVENKTILQFFLLSLSLSKKHRRDIYEIRLVENENQANVSRKHENSASKQNATHVWGTCIHSRSVGLKTGGLSSS